MGREVKGAELEALRHQVAAGCRILGARGLAEDVRVVALDGKGGR